MQPTINAIIMQYLDKMVVMVMYTGRQIRSFISKEELYIEMLISLAVLLFFLVAV